MGRPTRNAHQLGERQEHPSRPLTDALERKTRPNPRGVKSPSVPPIALKPKAAGLVHSLAAKLRITPEEFVTIAARKAERELEQTGGWVLAGKRRPHRAKEKPASAPALKATDLVSEKTAARVVELDRLLSLTGADRIAEVLLGNLARSIGRHGSGTILEGWVFSDPATVKRDLAKLAVHWAREDAAEASANGKEGKAP